MTRFVNPIPQYLLANGNIAVGGTLTFYRSGTDALLDLYSDADLSVALSNPVTLDARGSVPNIFFETDARVVLKDADDVQIFDVDPVSASAGASGGGFSAWSVNSTYNQLSVVTGEDGQFYLSLVNENTGNNPTGDTNDSIYWTQVKFLKQWNEQEVYGVNDLVERLGKIYSSQVGSNESIDPSTDTLGNWLSIADASLVPYDNTTSGLVATDAQSAIDELVTDIAALPSASNYKGQLDVSSGDAALPSSPTNGDLYLISTGGTITVSSNGAAPAPTAVTAGQAIIYNGDETQWDLIASVQNAASVSYNNTTSGLTATNVQTALDEIDSNVDTNASAIVTLNATVAGLGTGSSYKGQLDVSAGDPSLPSTPAAGDLYYISTGGTITVSSGGGAPTPTAVDRGDAIIYNAGLVQWDLLVDQGSAVVDEGAAYEWTGPHNWTGDTPTIDSNNILDTDSIYDVTQNLVTTAVTVGYTFSTIDAGRTIIFTTDTAMNLNLSANVDLALDVGTVLSGVQYGAGALTINPAGGVTVNSANGLTTASQYGYWALLKIDTDEWLAYGDLTT